MPTFLQDGDEGGHGEVVGAVQGGQGVDEEVHQGSSRCHWPVDLPCSSQTYLAVAQHLAFWMWYKWQISELQQNLWRIVEARGSIQTMPGLRAMEGAALLSGNTETQ